MTGRESLRASSPGVESPTTLGQVMAWLRNRHGASWIETIRDIERSVADIQGTPLSLTDSTNHAQRRAGHPAAAPGSIEFATEQLDAGENDGGEGARTVKRPAAATAEPQPEFQPDEFPSGKLNATGQPASPSVPGDGFDVHELLGEYAMALASACHDLAGSIERQASTNARKALNAALDALLRRYEERGRVIEELADDGDEQGQDLKVACAEIDRLRTALEAVEAGKKAAYIEGWEDGSERGESLHSSSLHEYSQAEAQTAESAWAMSVASQGASGPEETRDA